MMLKFTKEEKINFLRMWGYSINLYESERESQLFPLEKNWIKIQLAHKEELLKADLDNMDDYHINQKYGLDVVFDNEFQTRLKKFLFKKL